MKKSYVPFANKARTQELTYAGGPQVANGDNRSAAAAQERGEMVFQRCGGGRRVIRKKIGGV